MKALPATLLGLVMFGAVALSIGHSPIVFVNRVIEDKKRPAFLSPILVVAAAIVPIGLLSLLEIVERRYRRDRGYVTRSLHRGRL